MSYEKKHVDEALDVLFDMASEMSSLSHKLIMYISDIAAEIKE